MAPPDLNYPMTARLEYSKAAEEQENDFKKQSHGDDKGP